MEGPRASPGLQVQWRADGKRGRDTELGKATAAGQLQASHEDPRAARNRVFPLIRRANRLRDLTLPAQATASSAKPFACWRRGRR